MHLITVPRGHTWFSGAIFLYPGTGLTHGWHLISLELDWVESVAILAELGVSCTLLLPPGLSPEDIWSDSKTISRYVGLKTLMTSLLGGQWLIVSESSWAGPAGIQTVVLMSSPCSPGWLHSGEERACSLGWEVLLWDSAPILSSWTSHLLVNNLFSFPNLQFSYL